MKTTLSEKVRALAHLLAYEEEAQIRSKGWHVRRKEHNYLLAKLYRIEKKV